MVFTCARPYLVKARVWSLWMQNCAFSGMHFALVLLAKWLWPSTGAVWLYTYVALHGRASLCLPIVASWATSVFAR